MRKSTLRNNLFSSTVLFFALTSQAMNAQEFGFSDAFGNKLDAIELTTQEVAYVCFGTGSRIVQVQGTKKIFFKSNSTAPADGLRVEIQNLTPGFEEDEVPYTDREYESEEKGSEKIIVKVDDEHRTKTFTVNAQLGLETVNTFSYGIYDKRAEDFFETGTFELPVTIVELPPATVLDDPRYCNIWDPGFPIPFP